MTMTRKMEKLYTKITCDTRRRLAMFVEIDTPSATLPFANLRSRPPKRLISAVNRCTKPWTPSHACAIIREWNVGKLAGNMDGSHRQAEGAPGGPHEIPRHVRGRRWPISPGHSERARW